MTNQDNVVGQNIKRFRERLNLSQEALANYLGVTHPTVSYYENGLRTIPVDTIIKAANLFGIDGYDLYQANTHEQKINVAFAFRANNLSTEDLAQIASFRQVVRNYLQMKKKALKREKESE